MDDTVFGCRFSGSRRVCDSYVFGGTPLPRNLGWYSINRRNRHVDRRYFGPAPVDAHVAVSLHIFENKNLLKYA